MRIGPKADVTVIIPALNEAGTILDVVEKCLKVADTVIVVDDGSSDGTGWLVVKEQPSVQVLFHKQRQGKGSSLLTALPHVKTPFVALQDADCEYDPLAIPLLMRVSADMVVGQRVMLMTDFYRHVGIGSFVANSIITRLIGSPDVFSGQRVLRTDFMRQLKLRSKGFAIETEMTIKAIASKSQIHYIPVSYYPRTKESGKKIGAIDFLKILLTYVHVTSLCALSRCFAGRQKSSTRNFHPSPQKNAV